MKEFHRKLKSKISAAVLNLQKYEKTIQCCIHTMTSTKARKIFLRTLYRMLNFLTYNGFQIKSMLGNF